MQVAIMYTAGAPKSFDNVVSISRYSSIPSIPAERIKGILEHELCIYGCSTGNTPRMLSSHKFDHISESHGQATLNDGQQNQRKMLFGKSFRPKSAGDTYKVVTSTDDIKESLSIHSIHSVPRNFNFSEKKPSRIRSARDYRSKNTDHEIGVHFSEETKFYLISDNDLANEKSTVKIQSARTRADIHVPGVEHLLETSDDLEQ
ncbi:unnamed protein product [Heterobilharzia americana]|nr:unnamed protein product [Heterobilharzia americana]CAH8460640.1 unnamed protein product [Heterobilharzia americana]